MITSIDHSFNISPFQHPFPGNRTELFQERTEYTTFTYFIPCLLSPTYRGECHDTTHVINWITTTKWTLVFLINRTTSRNGLADRYFLNSLLQASRRLGLEPPCESQNDLRSSKSHFLALNRFRSGMMTHSHRWVYSKRHGQFRNSLITST